MVTHSVICSCPDEDICWKPKPYIIPQDYHWVSCNKLFNLYRQKMAFSTCPISSTLCMFDI